MRGAALLVGVLVMLGSSLAVAAESTPGAVVFPNGGFEDGLAGWRIPPGEAMSEVSTEQAASGARSLHIRDNDPQRGSDVAGPRIAVSGGDVYELRGKVYAVSGTGLGVYMRVFDRNGRPHPSIETAHRDPGGRDRRWQPFSLTVYTDANTASLQLWLHSYGSAQVEAYVDDLELVSLGKPVLTPPWKGQYKIKAHEKTRLTAADVVGPDGLVYPNWTQCGVQGGIPQVRVAAHLEDFGAKPNDGLDDSQALDAACRAVGARGGGALLLGEGRYDLDRPVTIRDSGVVLRGQGPDKTKLFFRYALPPGGVAFYWPRDGATIGRDSPIELHCRPNGLTKMRILAGDAVLRQWDRGEDSGHTFTHTTSGKSLEQRVAPGGNVVLKGIADYDDGSQHTCQIHVRFEPAFREPSPVANAQAAITFQGRGPGGPRLRLAKDGRRGDTILDLEGVQGLQPGACILIDGPATPRWKQLTRNLCPWGDYRRYEVVIDKIEGTRVTLSQPLRIEFPVVDGSYVQQTVPIRRCGIEDLYIEQTEDLWITTVLFARAWDCWARGVTVRMCGRNPIYPSSAKWCEIRDCVFDDAWFKGGGGTAYTGWDMAWDCLMENVQTHQMRHAPLVQWAASGNVVRKSVFHASDGQWHSGWTHENLFEQCIIEATTGNGAYGSGLWASPPDDASHGPNGPRNVVYNCDIRSPKAGLWMGGMNEGWLILHNRFNVDSGPGVYAQTASFDHVLQGNVFVLKNALSPMVQLATRDCAGIELIDNQLVGGNGRLITGPGRPAVLKGNQARPLAEATRPRPAVPSIYEWQNRVRKP